MRLPRVRFTIRRMMIAVAAVTILSVQAGNWFRYAAAHRDYERDQTYYWEGRVCAEQCAEKSRRLLHAHLALCLTRWGQAAVITAHIERLSRLADEERSWLPGCNSGSIIAIIAEIEQMVSESKGMLKRVAGGP